MNNQLMLDQETRRLVYYMTNAIDSKSAKQEANNLAHERVPNSYTMSVTCTKGNMGEYQVTILLVTTRLV